MYNETRAKRSYYYADCDEFLNASEEAILGELTDNHMPLTLTVQQETGLERGNSDSQTGNARSWRWACYIRVYYPENGKENRCCYYQARACIPFGIQGL